MTDNKNIPALEISGLSHSFGSRQALKNVSVTVQKGQFCALLGLNGAGKTTLFSLITRLYDSISGSISVLGADVRRNSIAALQNLGVVFQNRTLDGDLTVIHNLIYHASLHGIGKKQAISTAMNELERLGLADRAKDKARSLSGGQARRVEIARALMHKPALLLLDEPTIGLDIESRQNIQHHVRRLMQEDGLGVLWATHLIDEVKDEDSLFILHQGEVLASGTVSDVVNENGSSDLPQTFIDLTGGDARKTAVA